MGIGEKGLNSAKYLAQRTKAPAFGTWQKRHNSVLPIFALKILQHFHTLGVKNIIQCREVTRFYMTNLLSGTLDVCGKICNHNGSSCFINQV